MNSEMQPPAENMGAVPSEASVFDGLKAALESSPPPPSIDPEEEKRLRGYELDQRVRSAGMPVVAARQALLWARSDGSEGKNGWWEKLRLARELVERKDTGRLVLFLGGVGTGKTSVAFVLGVEALMSAKTVRYLTWQDLGLHFEAAKAASEGVCDDEFSTRKAVNNYFSRLDLLILDEADKGMDSTATMRLITNVISAREAHRRPTIIISNFQARDLGKFLGPSLVDRANANRAALTFDWESFRR
jgi:DNA replication protein DnaC